MKRKCNKCEEESNGEVGARCGREFSEECGVGTRPCCGTYEEAQPGADPEELEREVKEFIRSLIRREAPNV